jgi:hypothetical protein
VVVRKDGRLTKSEGRALVVKLMDLPTEKLEYGVANCPDPSCYFCTVMRGELRFRKLSPEEQAKELTELARRLQ